MARTFLQKIAEKDERLAIRVSAKDKFAIELYAQKHGKTISAVAKEAIDAVLKHPDTGLFTTSADGRETVYVPDTCWDPLAPDRLAKLGLYAPGLLNDQDRLLWKVIEEDRQYWQANGELKFSAVREDWIKIQEKATQLLTNHGS